MTEPHVLLPIEKQLRALADPAYQSFQSRLIPTLPPSAILGVRTPALRNFLKSFAKTPEAATFLQQLPHRFYEENLLHVWLVSEMPDFFACLSAVDHTLPFVDNWAVCDTFTPKVFARHHQELLREIPRWLADAHPYTIRFGLSMLMRHFLEDDFLPAHLEWAVNVTHPDYYVKMMVAWYLATALAKQHDATLPLLEGNRLDPWTHRRTIQKALESYRITPEQKVYLRSLRDARFFRQKRKG
ncbi:MAG: DNA alkylation repair protein [Schwartzia sp. (in: firmicutes)]